MAKGRPSITQSAQPNVNADLIGFRWTSGTGVEYEVIESWSVNAGYVVCKATDRNIDFIRPASVVRTVKRIDEAATA